MIKHKIAPSVDSNQWLKITQLNEPTNQNLSLKVVKPTENKALLKNFGTSAIDTDSPLSPLSLDYLTLDDSVGIDVAVP